MKKMGPLIFVLFCESSVVSERCQTDCSRRVLSGEKTAFCKPFASPGAVRDKIGV